MNNFHLYLKYPDGTILKVELMDTCCMSGMGFQWIPAKYEVLNTSWELKGPGLV